MCDGSTSRPIGQSTRRVLLVILGLLLVFGTSAQTSPEIYIAAGHEPLGRIDAVFSPDGKLLATYAADVYRAIKLWDVQTGDELRSFESPTLSTTEIVFLQDSTRFLWGDEINSLSLVDVRTGEIRKGICPKEYTCGATVYAVSADGRVVSTESQSRSDVEVFELDSLKPIRKISLPSSVTGIALNDDGTLVAFAEEFRVQVMELSSGRIVGRFDSAISNPKFGFAGGTLICRCGEASVSGWSALAGTRLYERNWNAGTLLNFQILSNGLFVTQDSLGKTKIWRADNGSETNSLDLNVGTAVFGPTAMVYKQEDDDFVLFRFGDLKPSILRNRANPVTGLALGESGDWIASGDWRSIRIWRGPNVSVPFSVPIYPAKGIVLNRDGEIFSTHFGSQPIAEMIDRWTSVGGVASKALPANGSTSEYYYAAIRVLSSDGKLLASVTDDGKRLRLTDTVAGIELPVEITEPRGILDARFSGGGARLAYLVGKAGDGAPSQIKVFDVAARRNVGTVDLGNEDGFDGKPVPINPTMFTISARGDRVAAPIGYNKIRIFNAVSGATVATSDLERQMIVSNLKFAPDGKVVVAVVLDGSVWLADSTASGSARRFSTERLKKAYHIEFARDGSLLGISDGGRVVIFDFRTQRELVTLVAMPGDEWLAVTPDGRFDGSPGSFDAVKWRFSKNLYDIAPAEAFFADFYYPGLIDDLLNGRMPAAVSNPAAKDRRQPTIKVTLDDGNFYRSTSTRNIRLKIKISDSPAGARDLRLFRNGTLVKIWRGELLGGRQSLDLDVDVAVTEGENKYTAYAFNSDNVKSREDSVWVTGEEALRRKRTAYVVVIGVNRYENREFDLSYAATDAASFADAFGKAQSAFGEFDRVELTALSDSQATKSAIAGALRELSRKAQPEDEVAIFFAGHGLALGDRFYLVPTDLGYQGRRDQLGPDGIRTITEHSISDVELEGLLEPVAAERIFMVIDACNSGQALESEEKRRGPMNSRGLAQLAYEKGMYILTASQSYQLATESSALGHGYLTYALVEDGIRAGRADRSPADGKITMREWFDYAIERVPTIFTAEKERKRQLAREKDTPAPRVTNESGQVPRVFYRREQDRKPWLVSSVAK